jgi:TusA-related sulfurtransferase
MLSLKANIVDARGRACPEPVLMTKKAVAANPSGASILVDNTTARENIKRFGKNKGYAVDVTEDQEGILLVLSK